MQSLVLASLFAWIEGLFVLGYRPRLQAQLEQRVREKQARMDGGKDAGSRAQGAQQPQGAVTERLLHQPASS